MSALPLPNALIPALIIAFVAASGCDRTPGAPNPDFRADVRAGKADLTVQFSDRSEPGDAPITSWAWDFGDGSTSEEPEPEHTYTENGYHSVRLTVANELGERSTFKADYIFVGNVWARTDGGGENGKGVAIGRMPTNGFVVAGTVDSGEGDTDIRVARYDSQGEILWSHNFGGDRDDEAAALHTFADGDIVVVGTTRSFGAARRDILVFRLNLNGEERWSNTYGTTNDDWARSMVMADGGFLIAGESVPLGTAFPDPYFLLINNNGQQQWARYVTHEGPDTVYSVTDHGDGYAYTGITGIGTPQILAGKIAANGDAEWIETYGGIGEHRGHAITAAGNGLLILGTRISGAATGIDMGLLRLDGEGVEQWSRFYGGIGRDEGRGIMSISNGFLLVGSSTSNTAGGADVYLVNVDNDGEARWSRRIGGPRNDTAMAAASLGNGFFGVVGTTTSFHEDNSALYMLRTNIDGIAPAIPPGATLLEAEEEPEGEGEAD